VNKAYLQQIREIQGQTGPNMCLASSKFLALKLLGFVDPTKKLNDFLHSRWALRHKHLPLKSYWGGSMTEFNAAFNKTALLAAVNDPSAGVKAAGIGQIRFATGFTTLHGTKMADTMLHQGTPLVVGVSIHGGSGRDHFILIFRDPGARIWAVDPWPGDLENAVVELGRDMTFTKKFKIHLTADATNTEIPCGVPFFGYFK
jgi:hypothetical protein